MGVIIDSKIMASHFKGGNLMKKALSVFLAVLMMFSVLGVGSFAVEDTTGSSSQFTSPWHGPEGSGKPAGYDQVVIRFNLNDGTLKNAQYVWNLETGKPEYTEANKIVGTWVMVPQYKGDMVADGEHYVTLPTITPPSNTLAFDGWYCQYDRSLYGAGAYRIPAGAGGQVIEFTAQWSPTQPEEDPLPKVLGILFKVFGTIIGILFYAGDTEAGIALMEKVFGGLF